MLVTMEKRLWPMVCRPLLNDSLDTWGYGFCIAEL